MSLRKFNTRLFGDVRFESAKVLGLYTLKLFLSAILIISLNLRIVGDCYGQHQDLSISDLRYLMPENASFVPSTNEESIFLSDPALALYFSLGIGLIGKLYVNWMKETGAINQQTIEWLVRFNEEKNRMQRAHPRLNQLEIEFLTLQTMEGKNASLKSLSKCRSCGNSHGPGGHHTHPEGGHHHSNTEDSRHEVNERESVEEMLNTWLIAMHQIGQLSDSELKMQNLPLYESSDNLITGGTASRRVIAREISGSWTEAVMGLFSQQIDLHLDLIQSGHFSLDDLRADYGGTPLFRLHKLKSMFFKLHRGLIKKFLLGFVKVVIQSGKLTIWDYMLRPAVSAFKKPRQAVLSFSSRAQVSRHEKGQLSSALIGSMGVSIFFVYEFVLHGILNIHTFCNHSLQLSLAMATAGFVNDLVKQPFKVYSLLPSYFTLVERFQLRLSVALAQWCRIST